MYKNPRKKKSRRAAENEKKEGGEGNAVGVIQRFALTVSFDSRLYQCLFLQNLQQ